MIVSFSCGISLSLRRIDGVLNTDMICRPSGAITNFQLYLLQRSLKIIIDTPKIHLLCITLILGPVDIRGCDLA